MPKRREDEASGSTRLAEMRDKLARQIRALTKTGGDHATGIPGLFVHRRDIATNCYPGTYEPSLTLFAQGKKRISFGGTTHLCDGTTMLLASIDMPVISEIVEATENVPYLSMTLKLDMSLVREIFSQEELLQAGEGLTSGGGLAFGTTPLELLEAFSRLLKLLDTPNDIPFLGNLMQREILYRLLRGPHGQRLRAIVTTGDQSQRIAKAIAWLRTHYAKPLRVERLAEVVRMGVSTLHHHFHLLTDMSPLQYQKRLRLQVARQRMLVDGLDAASAAFEVGYESASQFNREYSRMFGQPPIRDVKTLRNTNSVAESVN
jgi:AraC-like DNA-binding protein